MNNPQTPDAVVQRVIEKVNSLNTKLGNSPIGKEEIEWVQESSLRYAIALCYFLPERYKSKEHIETMLNERSLVGIVKYGTTLQDADLSKEQVLEHAVEKLLDAANYLEKLLAILENKQE
jgi:hypothetical protein